MGERCIVHVVSDIMTHCFLWFRIMKMIESGLVEQWMRKYWPDVVGRCGSGGTRSINPVSMSDTVGIFYLLVIGLGAATLVFGLEWLVSKHRERQMGRDRDRPT